MANKRGFFKSAGSLIGDAGRYYADNALSSWGANNVIQDSDYENDWVGKASNISNQISKVGTQVAAGIALPGVGSAAVGAVQQGGGMLNPELRPPKVNPSFNTQPDITGMASYADGGLIFYKGNPKQVDGINVGGKFMADHGEVSKDDYMFSNRIPHLASGGKITYADKAKKLYSKYNKGDRLVNDDKPSREAFNNEIAMLQQEQEEAKYAMGIADEYEQLCRGGKIKRATGGKLPGYAWGGEDYPEGTFNKPWINDEQSLLGGLGYDNMMQIPPSVSKGDLPMSVPYRNQVKVGLPDSTLKNTYTDQVGEMGAPETGSNIPQLSQYAMMAQGAATLGQGIMLATQKPQYQKYTPLQKAKFNRVNPNAAIQDAKEGYAGAARGLKQMSGNTGQYLSGRTVLGADQTNKVAGIRQGYDAQNSQIQMHEAQSNAQIAMHNAEMKLKVGEINAQEYDAIRSQWMNYLSGISNQSAGMSKDVMAYQNQSDYVKTMGDMYNYRTSEDMRKILFQDWTKKSKGGRIK